MRKIYAAIAVGLCALLMACSHTPPPAVEVRTVEVRVPVPTPCIDGKVVPAEPEKVGSRLNGKAAHDLDIVFSSAIMLRQWGRELRALIEPCVKP